MSRVLVQKKVWVSVVICTKCGIEHEFWHHGITAKKEAIRDWPSESWNGWSLVKGKELCCICQHIKKLL